MTDTGGQLEEHEQTDESSDPYALENVNNYRSCQIYANLGFRP